MLTGPDPLVVLHMSGQRTQDESLHNLRWHQGEADMPVVPGILLLALLVDGRRDTRYLVHLETLEI